MRTDTLVTSVQKIINSFMENNPNMSLSEVADKSMSSLTTIRGLKNGNIQYLSAKKALEISQRLSGPKNLEGIVSLSEESDAIDVAQDFQKRFSHLFPYDMQPGSFDPFLANKDYARIIWAAFGATHITKSEIEYRWGQEGLKNLNELLKINLLVEDDGLIKGNTENGGFNLDSTYRQLGLGYQMYSPANRENQENWVSFQTQSVNPKFVQEFREKMRELFEEFHSKSNSYEFQGDQRMFFGMIYDRYMTDLDNPKELQ